MRMNMPTIDCRFERFASFLKNSPSSICICYNKQMAKLFIFRPVFILLKKPLAKE